jgi:hypothetical protein
MDLSLISQGYLNAIARQLNNRPRRCLDDETPLRSSYVKSVTQRAVLHFKLEAAQGCHVFSLTMCTEISESKNAELLVSQAPFIGISSELGCTDHENHLSRPENYNDAFIIIKASTCMLREGAY